MAQHARVPMDGESYESRSAARGRANGAARDRARGSDGYEPYGSYGAPRPERKRVVPVWVFVLVALVCLVGGGLIGRFVLTPTYDYVSGKTTLTEQELDSIVGTYEVNGAYHEITARQAIETTLSLDAALQEDGTYAMPSADSVLAAARNQILNDAVAQAGIEVTDEDIDAYAQSTLGTSDYATLAQQYGMTEDQVRAMVKESAGVQKLYQQMAGESDVTANAPAAPAVPAEGQEDAPTAEYGAYIVGLLGDNWDSSADTWSNTENPYYTALSDEVFSSDSASYNQAMEAYYVAYQAYADQAGEQTSSWTDYVNGLMANATITIGELVS